MKILIVNSSDLNGGAARASYRLHKSLLDSEIDSQMLVQDKLSDDYTVIGPSTKIQKGLAKLRPALDNLPLSLYTNRQKIPFSTSWLGFSGIINKINKINPDIVHLHWICGGMMTIEDIARIKYPIVWSLHDMWAFTAGSHYAVCQGYKEKNGNCMSLRSKRKFNLSSRIFRRKYKTYSKKNDITIVGLSKWINECSKSSYLLGNNHHVNIPNPINTKIFKKFDKDSARDLWNLPKNKKLVLFGAMSATSDPRKGFNELRKAFKLLTCSEVELIVFGSSKPKDSPDLGFPTHYLGKLSDDVSLSTLYSAVDVTVVPSLQENLANCIVESLACGTPVVGFEIDGNGDMIEHKKNGFLAKPFKSEDLALGIEWVLNAKNYDELSFNARSKILKEFDSTIVAERYIDLYKQILS